MTKMRLNTMDRTSSLGMWVPTRDGGYRCGNVKVKPRQEDRPWPTWRIYVRLRSGRWQMVAGKQRHWGYGHQGQAKIVAALMAAHQRGVFQ